MAIGKGDVLAGHLQELRRGTVVLAALAHLRTPGYGYALLEDLAAAGFEVDANTLYPLLRRLEKQGLVERHPHPTDGRTTLAVITDEGREVVERATKVLNDDVFGAIGLSERESGQLYRLLEKLRLR